MKNISSIFVAALLTGSCGLVAQTDAVPNDLFGKVKISLPEGLNSASLEFSPIYFNDGLIFTSDRFGTNEKKGVFSNGKKFTDLFFSEQMGEVSFKAPKPIGKLNTKYHDGIASYSEADQKLYFTRSNRKGTVLNTKKAKRLKIFVSRYTDGVWSDPQPVSFNVEKYSTCHPAISADGKTMYFASNRPGGLGEMDIYVTHLENEKWTDPVNMGPDINTAQNEIFPFNDVNGTLYFSSEGHENLGGLDMFMAEEVVNPHNPGEDNWEITNLGEPFNSFEDDFGFVENGKGNEGFFTSGRTGGGGGDDIYAWKSEPEAPEKPVLAIARKKVKVVDAITGKELAMTNIILSEANRPGSIIRYTTTEDGMMSFDWNTESQYVIETQKTGYVDYSKVYEVEEMADDIVVIRINPMKDIAATTPKINTNPTKVVATIAEDSRVEAHEEDIENFYAKGEKTENASLETGQLIELNHIYYEFDKYNIKESAKVELDKVVTLLRQYPEMEIDLNSHTDSRGTDGYNEWLSQERAKSAVNYIVSKGIDAQRVTAKGYGEGLPVNECLNTMKCSEDKHQMNRRTEFLIKNMGEKTILKSNTSKPKKLTFQGGGNGPDNLPVLQSIFHASGQTGLTSTDKEELKSLVNTMKKHEAMTVRIASFTDAVGNETFNQTLSEKRAQYIANYISSQGIRGRRIEMIGYGENFLTDCLNPADCPTGAYDQNRRTDIQITNPGDVDVTALLEK